MPHHWAAASGLKAVLELYVADPELSSQLEARDKVSKQ